MIVFIIWLSVGTLGTMVEQANLDPVFVNECCAAILDPIEAEPVGLSKTATWLELSGDVQYVIITLMRKPEHYVKLQ